ncbi:MAG: PEGA domain-containing protein [Opitutaceae bacterium]|nr:PEGA domain-containing protein [Cytophagales bacterium]
MRTILIFFLLIVCSSCATILKGSKEKVSFISESGNSSVYINGKYVSNTPFYTKLRSNKNYEITMVKDSINKRTIFINRKFKPWYLVGDLLCVHTFYLSPAIIVDALTGAWFRLDKDIVIYTNEK